MDDADHRREAARIEELLEDLRGLAAGPVWQRIEELVQRLVHLYGAGFERWAHHLGEAGVADALADRVAGDELLASLLLLHGLHPWPVERRIADALLRAQAQLRAHAGDVSGVAVEGPLARVRLTGATVTADVAERLILRVLAESAPEIARVEVEGAARPVREPPEALVQIRPRPEVSR